MRSERYLMIYSGVLTAVFAVTVLSGFVAKPSHQLGEIDVERINIREPDGTLRMVIANSKDMPGVIVKGKEQPKVDRPQAGVIFYNDEGSENGGLIFGGKREADGKIADSGASLSFDQYNAKQVVQLIGVDDKDLKEAGLAVTDNKESGGNDRVWVGRKDDGTSSVALMDAQGHVRLLLKVAANGAATLNFLDQDGHITKSVGG